MAEISSLSRENVYVPVSFTDPVTGQVQDPTLDSVQLAFTDLYTDPVSNDWHPGSWRAGGPPYIASILVGPGGTVVLAKGNYRIWVKVTDNPEIPAKRDGFLVVT